MSAMNCEPALGTCQWEYALGMHGEELWFFNDTLLNF